MYPDGRRCSPTSPATSRSSSAPRASSGTYNDELAGQHRRPAAARAARLPRRARPTSATSRSPLRADVQAVAPAGPGRTHAARSWPSTPAPAPSWPCTPTRRYDPNPLAGHDLDAVRGRPPGAARRTRRTRCCAQPYQERYLPGSTFKVVTATAGLDTGAVTPATVYPRHERATCRPAPPTRSRTSAATACGGALLEILRRRCNTAFAQMGVDLGAEGMVRTAEAFGFNDAPPIDLPRPAQSSFPSVERLPLDNPKLAQVEHRPERRPSHAAADGPGGGGGRQRRRDHGAPRDGRGPRPRRRRGRSATSPRPWQTATDARPRWPSCNQAMIEVVNNGTARAACSWPTACRSRPRPARPS